MVFRVRALLRFHRLRVAPLIGERGHANSNDREHDHEMNRNSASHGSGTIAKQFHRFCLVISQLGRSVRQSGEANPPVRAFESLDSPREFRCPAKKARRRATQPPEETRRDHGNNLALIFPNPDSIRGVGGSGGRS
jgi:hypothetical protein